MNIDNQLEKILGRINEIENSVTKLENGVVIPTDKVSEYASLIEAHRRLMSLQEFLEANQINPADPRFAPIFNNNERASETVNVEPALEPSVDEQSIAEEVAPETIEEVVSKQELSQPGDTEIVEEPVVEETIDTPVETVEETVTETVEVPVEEIAESQEEPQDVQEQLEDKVEEVVEPTFSTVETDTLNNEQKQINSVNIAVTNLIRKKYVSGNVNALGEELDESDKVALNYMQESLNSNALMDSERKLFEDVLVWAGYKVASSNYHMKKDEIIDNRIEVHRPEKAELININVGPLKKEESLVVQSETEEIKIPEIKVPVAEKNIEEAVEQISEAINAQEEPKEEVIDYKKAVNDLFQRQLTFQPKNFSEKDHKVFAWIRDEMEPKTAAHERTLNNLLAWGGYEQMKHHFKSPVQPEPVVVKEEPVKSTPASPVEEVKQPVKSNPVSEPSKKVATSSKGKFEKTGTKKRKVIGRRLFKWPNVQVKKFSVTKAIKKIDYLINDRTDEFIRLDQKIAKLSLNLKRLSTEEANVLLNELFSEVKDAEGIYIEENKALYKRLASIQRKINWRESFRSFVGADLDDEDEEEYYEEDSRSAR